MLGKAYLRRTMLGRILAAFALITGLAATGTPASARMLTAVSQQVDANNQAQQAATQVPCPVVGTRNGLNTKVAAQAGCRARKPVIIYLPTVQFGADRAFE